MIVEICANSYQSAIHADQAGAKRIELCSELAVGGITPSYGLIKQVLAQVKLSVFVLIRPRSGDFVYSKAEFDIMKQNIQLCKDLGCQGIVSGVLNPDNTIDISRTQELIECAKPLSFTFHRAFDCVEDPFQALDDLIGLGVDRILTSGQETSALKGMTLLKTLQEKAKNKLTILCGGGVTVENVNQFKLEGFKEVHCSLTTFHPAKGHYKLELNSATHFNHLGNAISDLEKIKTILKQIKNEG